MSETQEPEFIRGNAPKIYNYHLVSGEYWGQDYPAPSPMDNEWIFPAYCTLIEPPKFEAKQMAVFNKTPDDMMLGEWVIVPDHRGETWYAENGESVTIDTLGDPSEQGLLKEKPPEPEKPIVYPDLTARQIRLGLRQLGLLNQVQPLINQLPSGQKEDAQIEWDYATDFKRDHWLIGQIAQALNIDENTFNQKWLEFSQL